MKAFYLTFANQTTLFLKLFNQRLRRFPVFFQFFESDM